ncbi:MAG: protein SCO1/2 [Halioglobus sp.]|jgi:protein SCO1/2
MASPRSKLIAGFVLANIIIAIVAAVVWLNKPDPPPQIQGVLLNQARALGEFSLLDQNNKPFSNENLMGRWHLVTYGFTTCPDVCPTTLATLAQVSNRLDADRDPYSEGKSLRVLFYSVDHRRDTVQQLAAYVPFFDEKFVGLTHLDSSANPHLPFEQGLGIFARLTPSDELVDGEFTNAYDVSHGVTLFLINPEGKLQAILEPGEDENGSQVFDEEKVLQDYLKVRRYVGWDQSNTAF